MFYERQHAPHCAKLLKIAALQEVPDMPNTFNFLICMLALLVGILIGEKYRKWKIQREEKKNDSKGADIKLTDGSGSDKKDSDTEPPV